MAGELPPSGELLRKGYTTGACAAAAAAAATRALLTGELVDAVRVDLPAEKGVTFGVSCRRLGGERVVCSTVKDAGDDPDVTHGATIEATAEWIETLGIEITGGVGVGTVTKPGLVVPVGEKAINPVPRKLIRRAVRRELERVPSARGIRITISVPGGEELAERTMNPRLGIVGGISILGTTGIVKPYSREAYRASIYLELKVGASEGASRAVLTTGNRSEEYSRALYPDWQDTAFVQVGDHMGYALRQAARLEYRQVVIAGMAGKISKLAQGRMQTHVNEGDVDLDFLAAVVRQLGGDEALVERVRSANTARHVQQILRKEGFSGLEVKLAQMAATQAYEHASTVPVVRVLLFDIGGELLGQGEAGSIS